MQAIASARDGTITPSAAPAAPQIATDTVPPAPAEFGGDAAASGDDAGRSGGGLGARGGGGDELGGRAVGALDIGTPSGIQAVNAVPPATGGGGDSGRDGMSLWALVAIVAAIVAVAVAIAAAVAVRWFRRGRGRRGLKRLGSNAPTYAARSPAPVRPNACACVCVYTGMLAVCTFR